MSLDVYQETEKQINVPMRHIIHNDKKRNTIYFHSDCFYFFHTLPRKSLWSKNGFVSSLDAHRVPFR